MDGDKNHTLEALWELESLEKDTCNLSLIFSEVFKDEIDANDDQKLYNGVKRVIKKYAADTAAFAAIEEFTRVISGGASLLEILQVVKEEAQNPTLATDLTVDKNCNLH